MGVVYSPSGVRFMQASKTNRGGPVYPVIDFETMGQHHELDPELVTMYTRLIRLGLSVDTMEYDHGNYYAMFENILPNILFIIQFTVAGHSQVGSDWRPIPSQIQFITHIEVDYLYTDKSDKKRGRLGRLSNLYHQELEQEYNSLNHLASIALTSYNKFDIPAELAEFIEDYLE